jgi:hypothetical protein
VFSLAGSNEMIVIGEPELHKGSPRKATKQSGNTLRSRHILFDQTPPARR